MPTRSFAHKVEHEKMGLYDEIKQIASEIASGNSGGGGATIIAGKDGKQIELQKGTTHIEWRYVGDESWQGLVAIEDIRGEEGPVGPNEITTSTDTNLTGVLKGTGTKIAQATAGTDYVAPNVVTNGDIIIKAGRKMVFDG